MVQGIVIVSGRKSTSILKISVVGWNWNVFVVFLGLLLVLLGYYCII
jgi:hypothetical protein